MAHYTKEQIEVLGIRPRNRKENPKTGHVDLTPCEKREIKAVQNVMIEDYRLWQFWRLIPFEYGCACQRRKEFDDWIKEEVEGMWYEIGVPEFDPGTLNWHCNDGWWPYLRTRFIDISNMVVGNAIIDLDEVFKTLRNRIEEKVWGYRMCPGMKLYRTVIKYLELDDLASAMKANSRDLAELERLRNEMAMLANIFPTAATAKAPDREHYSTKYVRYKNEGEKN